MNSLRKSFLEAVAQDNSWQWLVIAVEMPNLNIELITNHSLAISEKIQYYINAYDDQFQLKANPTIRIIKYMLI